jgi:NAD(P)-dependent dehydrogenase (short-subunit alcohol dehydrogenase family)/rhamnose utilization protein RhaD (predicted bifunctional aldolase and dehydrogenase)
MEHRWDDNAPENSDPLAQCVHAARLLGAQPELGLPGVGSISVKIPLADLAGEEQDTLFVSGRDQNLAAMQAEDLTPLRRGPLTNLLRLEALTPEQLDNELLCQRTRANAMLASADALVHAGLPDRYVAITQPDALLAIVSTPSAAQHFARLYGASVAYLAADPGSLALAQVAARTRASLPGLLGMVSSDGQLIAFGASAREVYDRVVELVTRAERYLHEHHAWEIAVPPVSASEEPKRHARATLRRALAERVGHPIIVTALTDPVCLAFAQREDRAGLMPGVFGAREAATDTGIVFDPDLGLCAVGRTAEQAAWASDAWRRRIAVSLRATALEKYQPRPAPRTTFKPGLFAGEVALVTGAASGIGKACVESLLARGAAVVGLDISPKIVDLFRQASFLGLACDVTDEAAVVRAFEALAARFGGLDMLVLNAGVFPASCRIDTLDLAEWDRVMRVNLDANVTLMREAYPMLKQSPKGGRVVVNASKNVLAPGAGAAAYSASKAALTQLGRVAALEWSKDHIRVNIVHPDQVFDTGVWTEKVLQARAAHYGLTVQQYKTRNLLGTELNSHYVGEVIAEMLGPLFEKITGAQLPVDGGSDRVI